jgi:hypothetical protein
MTAVTFALTLGKDAMKGDEDEEDEDEVGVL